MFPSMLTADDVCHVYWQLVFSKPVNELQCSSLLQKKGLCVYDVCVWAVVEEGAVCVCVCVLLLMSHDFPLFTPL